MTKKKRTNVSLDADLMRQVHTPSVSLAASFDEKLREEVTSRRQAAWRVENRGAIADANAFLEKHGLWSDGLLQF